MLIASTGLSSHFSASPASQRHGEVGAALHQRLDTVPVELDQRLAQLVLRHLGDLGRAFAFEALDGDHLEAAILEEFFTFLSPTGQ